MSIADTGRFWEIQVIPVLQILEDSGKYWLFQYCRYWKILENTGYTSIADTGRFWKILVIPQALVARTYHPPFSNFLFTNLFSIKFLYFFIISSLFPYFNLFVLIFIQSYVNIKLHVSTLYRYCGLLVSNLLHYVKWDQIVTFTGAQAD